MDITCEHEWKNNSGLDSIRCFECKWFPNKLHRTKCKKCYMEGRIICVEEYFDTSLTTKKDEYRENIKTLSLHEKINKLEQEINMLKERYKDLKMKFEKHIGKKKLDEIPEEFMNEENNQIIIHQIETCNKLGEKKGTSNRMYNKNIIFFN